MNQESLLVVDDEKAQLETLAGYLKKKGYTVLQAESGAQALSIAQQEYIDLVLTDMRMPEVNGLELLQRLKIINPEIAVVVMTAFGNIEDAVKAMQEGAEDYLQKPIDLDHLDIVLHKVLERRRLISENRELKKALRTKFEFKNIISGSAQMEEVLNIAGRAAKSKATVLLRGESGTGKEVLARAIHLAGPRAEKPFVAVNLAALPENLIESELFGFEKGAFTGADRQRKGRFEMSHTGTLFIDEVGDVPLSSQVKLLRVLQERSFERVGGAETVQVDVRVIAATNQDLEAKIREGSFREDLFYRLNVISIFIPPLRERKTEIPLFVDFFLRKYSAEEGTEIHSLTKEALDVLMKYEYPGNVRELENIIQRAVVLARSEVIHTDDLVPYLGSQTEIDTEQKSALVQSVEHLEISMINEALQNANGNQSKAARSLGISERHLRYKLKKYGMK